MSRVIRARRAPAVIVAPPPQTGLTFLANGVTGSDIRLNFVGANMPPRIGHTVIWKANYFQMPGFYATIWHTNNTGTWDPSFYQFGTHPYPCDGVHDGGLASNPGGSAGTQHFHELAGLPFYDIICTDQAASPLELVTGVELVQARVCSQSGDTMHHEFWPDLVGHPAYSIIVETSFGDYAVPSAPIFIIGCSPWTTTNWAGTGSGYSNDETPGSTVRGIQIYSAALLLAQIQARMSLTSDAAVISADPGSLFYCNINPTPTDVTDKSGAGHNPAWANANRPAMWP